MSRDRLPPLSALRVFEAAARNESFKSAAEELFVTPGAVSQQIRLLEEHIGTELFVRDGRRVVLTDAAKAAALLLREGFEKMFQATRILRQGLEKSRVTVSVAPSFAAKWLMPRLFEFNMAHEDVDVWISADMTPVDFAVSDIDLAIRYGPGHYPQLNVEHLLSESVVAVCSRELFAVAPINRIDDLAHHVLLHDVSSEIDPSCPDWPMWLKAHGAQSVDASRGPRFNQSYMVIEQALAGRGVALAKRTLAQSDLASGRLKLLFDGQESSLDYGYYLVWPQNRTLNAAQTKFIDWLRSQAQAHVPKDASRDVPKFPVFAASDI